MSRCVSQSDFGDIIFQGCLEQIDAVHCVSLYVQLEGETFSRDLD